MCPKDLGLKIKNLRVTKKLTQQEFADLLLIAHQTVSKWERGASYPDIFRLREICRVLGVSINEVLGEEQAESDDYMIAVDGSGAETKFVLFKADGTVFSSVTLETTNPNSCGTETSIDILIKGIEQLLCFGKSPSRIFVGIAGLSNYKGVIGPALKKVFPAFKISVDSNFKNVLGLVRNNSKCIAAIIGTGSVVYGWNGNSFKSIGGWGYLLGDAGSEYDIGRNVLSACYAYDDGLAHLSDVVRLAEIKLGGSVADSIDKIYSKGTSFIASFCHVAFEAMAMGDPLAKDIITESLGRLSSHINYMYNLGEYGSKVIISGGIVGHVDTANKIIADNLDEGISVELPTDPLIFGAMRTCAELEYGNVNYDEFKENFHKSYTNLK